MRRGAVPTPRTTVASAAIAGIVAAAAFGGAGQVRGAEPPDDACAVPERVLAADGDLVHARERIASGQPLGLLVVTTSRQPPQRTEALYPARLRDELVRRLPGVSVEGEVLNLPGHTASGMVAPMLTLVSARRPALVVWQTGTVEAVRNLDPLAFGTALAEGVGAIHRMGADVILVDMQYSMQTAQLIDFTPYVAHVRWASQNSAAVHFPRHDIMRYWVEAGRVDFGADSESEKRKSFEFVHGCIGRLLAGTIATLVTADATVAP
ncbi:hypothetical protein [Azospirillum halopraeferens]|uniref:hypothetical protein n=1 Tax=Azospirillum halopraeferens TaxID=34010 RepID=UPI00040D42A2|nr:hypothetical protein [Azospirillum halopraeferens]